MSAAASVLQAARAKGLTVDVVGGKLSVKPASKLDSGTRAQLIACKPEVIEIIVAEYAALAGEPMPQQLRAVRRGDEGEASSQRTPRNAGAVLAREPVLTNLANVQPQPVRWLWPQRIALGKLTMLAGDPGLGKSFLTLDLAARVTTGAPWPDGAGDAPAGSAILLSAEDDLADTIRPRLDAAGADPARVVSLSMMREVDPTDGHERLASFSLQRDLDALERAIAGVHACRLVVIDPITAYLGDADSHKNADIRALLAPMGDIASRHGVAIVAVSHLNKSSGGPAMYRTMGSLAFVAAARAAWAVTKDKETPTRRLLLPVKNNLGSDVQGLAFSLEPSASNPSMAVISWERDPVMLSADSALSLPGDDGERSTLDEACHWLRDLLADGSLPARDVKRRATEDGISPRTLDRAKAQLKIKAHKEGGRGGRWVWAREAPPQVEERQGCQDPHGGNLGDLGALCDQGVIQ